MSADCEGYYTKADVLVEGFTCPKADSDATALFCCGFSDLKYCCDDPNSFFPYEYGYMWWFELGSFVAGTIILYFELLFLIVIPIAT
ncbi:hypothetical protein JOQ06_024891, partial [Pogonophryne albipinna]